MGSPPSATLTLSADAPGTVYLRKKRCGYPWSALRLGHRWGARLPRRPEAHGFGRARGGCEDPQNPGARSTIHSDKPQDVNVPRDRTGAGGSPVPERVWGLWLRGCTPKTRRNSEQAAAREALTVGKVKEELDGNRGEECEAAVSRNKAQVTPRSDNAGPGDGQGRSRSYSVNDHCRKMSTAFTC